MAVSYHRRQFHLDRFFSRAKRRGYFSYLREAMRITQGTAKNTYGPSSAITC